MTAGWLLSWQRDPAKATWTTLPESYRTRAEALVAARLLSGREEYRGVLWQSKSRRSLLTETVGRFE